MWKQPQYDESLWAFVMGLHRITPIVSWHVMFSRACATKMIGKTTVLSTALDDYEIKLVTQALKQ